MLTDPNDAAIARTILALAQNLGLSVIVEGLESEAQFKIHNVVPACGESGQLR